MTDIENTMSDWRMPDEVPKRDFLIEKVKNGKPISNSKTPWTLERLTKASDKVINKLYANLNKPPPNKDLMSRFAGVRSVDHMMKDINGNFLIKNSTSEMIGSVTSSIGFSGETPMELFGSYAYEKCGIYLAPVSLFCTVFNHLDWQTFANIAEQRKMQAVQKQDEEILPELINDLDLKTDELNLK